eukprot:gnl/TRDRNA2_/TRDRNA2_166576_c1_seq1.p1 gnl/TRDRNA2_/TRDRNA2_166576_c1~~gnl/TRDRNA2_/TRDRNA2_166576_c1_seq1.p1  ORF type:complete len:442 (+),score=108.45 gnl/TRDRNA2_/TRDRNA2_166576_c1_seq1:3-1328(+)
MIDELSASVLVEALVRDGGKHPDVVRGPEEKDVFLSDGKGQFSKGARVRIKGLEEKIAWNGRIGTIHSWDSKQRRWRVVMDNKSRKLWCTEHLEVVSGDDPTLSLTTAAVQAEAGTGARALPEIATANHAGTDAGTAVSTSASATEAASAAKRSVAADGAADHEHRPWVRRRPQVKSSRMRLAAIAGAAPQPFAAAAQQSGDNGEQLQCAAAAGAAAEVAAATDSVDANEQLQQCEDSTALQVFDPAMDLPIETMDLPIEKASVSQPVEPSFLRVLACGDLHGRLDLLEKAIQDFMKRGQKPDLVLASGKTLGTGESFAKYCEPDSLSAPLYFVDSDSEEFITSAAESREAIVTGPHIFLGACGATTIKGMSVAFLSGRYDEDDYKKAWGSGLFTKVVTEEEVAEAEKKRVFLTKSRPGTAAHYTANVVTEIKRQVTKKVG